MLHGNRSAIAISVLLVMGGAALADKPVILATGRRDPRVYAIDLEKAIKPANNNSARAILSRAKVGKDRLDGRPLGDPANIVLSPDGRTAYVVNHHGAIDNAEFLQHGGRGNIAILQVARMVRPDLDDTSGAVEVVHDSGWFGAVGLVLWGDKLIIGHAENHLTEDGGNRITVVDRDTGALLHHIELALGSPAHACSSFPVPFVSPFGPPVPPVAILSPDASWGCFPDPNGIAVGWGSDRRPYLFSANGGTDDVSVIDLDAALAGDRTPEIARIPTQIGPWGIAASPRGNLIVAANRESQAAAFEGNTISLIDVDRARMGDSGAEVARVLVGTDDPAVQTRPFIPSFTPDGRAIIVPNFRANNVSIVDVQRALHGDPHPEVARIPLTRPADPDGVVRPARPKGSAVTKDGRYAVISAGPRVDTFPGSGMVYVIDLRARTVVGQVTGVGNDPYGLTIAE